jgi:hypothetical protein
LPRLFANQTTALDSAHSIHIIPKSMHKDKLH